MENRIQELADKIYKEGVQKASLEAEQITNAAAAERERLLSSAKQEAEQIVAHAREEAARLKSQSEKEVASAVENATQALQSKVVQMISAEAVNRGVDEAFVSPDALYHVVLKMSEQMFANESNGVVVSAADAKPLEEYFRKHAQEVLKNKIQIREVAGRPAAFELAPADGAYKLEVSDEAFKSFFRDFLRPRLRALLFED